MFTRTKLSAKTGNTAVQIVENFRTDDTTKQQVVRHVGTGRTNEEVKQLRKLSETIKAQLEQERLNKESKKINIEHSKKSGTKQKRVVQKTMVNLSNIEETNRYVIGFHDVYGCIYDWLEFTNLFYRPKQKESAANLLRNMVLARIAQPASKRSTVDFLRENFGIEMNLSNVYHMMDKIDDRFCQKIQDKALLATLKIMNEPLKVMFYDATTLYFESFIDDELKGKGYSKDMKFNQAQVLLALLVTKNGLPVGYEIFSGSTYEGHTLVPVLEKLKKNYKLDEVIFVADRGMLNKENLEYLEKNNIKYVVGARLKSLSKVQQQKVLQWSKEIDKEKDATYTIEISKTKRIILSYRKERAYKDKTDRETAIQKLRQKLKRSKNPKSLISRYGYQKFLNVSGNAEFNVDEKKIQEAEVWDGITGLYTNQMDLGDLTIIEHYSSLWQVEESFRIKKHDLRIRPIYHWTPRRIKAHIAISFMAFACIRHLEYRVALQYKKLSPKKIKQELLNVQASIIKDKISKRQYIIPSKISKDAKNLYRILDIKTMHGVIRA